MLFATTKSWSWKSWSCSLPLFARLGGVSLIVVGILAGCGGGDPVGAVGGAVTLDGHTPGEAYIVFEDPTRGISVSAQLKADGTYTAQTFDMAGLPPGKYRIAVRPGSITTGEAPLVGEAEETNAAPTSPIPPCYTNSQSSGLTATVIAGENPPLDFRLTSRP